MSDIKIGSHSVGPKHRPFIIGELSANHNQSLKRALKIVDEAARVGVHAIKLQTYTAETMTLDIRDREFFIDDSKSLWKGESLYQLYQKAYTPWEWHKPIFDRCKKLGMVGFSTAYDETALDFLESLDVPCYKIASFENTDLPLIRQVAKTGKPMIISSGMATVSEMEETVNAARLSGCKELILLQCTSSYPSSPEFSNLVTIPHMRQLFQCQVGLSDHTLGIGVGVASIALGATVIEKHLTLDRKDGGVDSAFSMEIDEIGSLVTETERAWRAMGNVVYGPLDSERGSLKFRRSLYIVKPMKVGDIFSKANVRAIRPGRGLAPKHYEFFLGRRVNKDVPMGTPLSWDLLS